MQQIHATTMIYCWQNQRYWMIAPDHGLTLLLEDGAAGVRVDQAGRLSRSPALHAEIRSQNEKKVKRSVEHAHPEEDAKSQYESDHESEAAADEDESDFAVGQVVQTG
jgi:hypothetical protein